MSNLPYRAEYAKSGRAACKGCKQLIGAGELRLAIMVQSPFFDGMQPNWHHSRCFFLRTRAKSVDEIAHYQDLRWADQEDITKQIESSINGSAAPVPTSTKSSGKGKAKGKKRGEPPSDPSLPADITDYTVEYAKSNRSKCKVCEEQINKGDVRISKKDYEGEVAKRYGPVERWHHIDCFDRARKELNFFAAGSALPGFNSLAPDDQVLLKEKFPALERDVTDAPTSAKKPKVEDPKLQKAMKAQNKDVFKIRDKLEELSKKDLVLLLEFNKQEIPTGVDKILDRLADLMTFGNVESCPTCSKGSLVFRSGVGYQCKGYVTDWSKCEAIFEKPKRTDFKIPKELKTEYPFLKSYKCKIQDRAFKKADIPVEPVAASNGSKSDTVDGAASKSVYPSKSTASSAFKSELTTKKMTLKGGLFVDPDSKLEKKAHVYRRQDEIFSVVLSLADVQTQKNSYYKLQVLEADKGNRYWLFRSWGRVGTTIGGDKTEEYSTLDEAINVFEHLFEEKSGNSWGLRHNFEKVPGKMMMLDVQHGNEPETNTKMSVDSKSKLDIAIQELITLIFDIEAMKKTMMEFELDLNKMPLGKLSRKQITSAFTILTELQTLRQNNVDRAQILDRTNRFYTLVPHDFGINNPPILDNDELINQKIDMLNNLMEIEIAYKLLETANESDESPIDSHYKKLKTNITVLDKKSDEFDAISKYVKNTHASTHSTYKLKVQQVFKIERQGEAKNFSKFKKLDNRMLLWHGSRTTNFAGILSQGLRIAPPEAPSTGYMFGKGIYFADMVSKSANYCMTSQKNNTGLLLLCEVALGNIKELKNSEYITKLPAGTHSVKGVGKTQPSTEDGGKTASGALIPNGKKKTKLSGNTSLLYNEYIVYDVHQVQIQYLVRMKFVY